LFKQLYEKIKQKIRIEFWKETRFQSSIDQEGHPTFDDRGLISALIEESDLNNWQAFTSDTEASRRLIICQEQKHAVYNVDKAFVDNMAIRLTNVVCTSEIRADIYNYRNIMKSKEANRQLGKLINSLKLGEAFDGTCHICIKYHDGKDILR
jgi:hypothetical protein